MFLIVDEIIFGKVQNTYLNRELLESQYMII